MAEKQEPSVISTILGSIIKNDFKSASKKVAINVIGPKISDFIVTVLKSLIDNIFKEGSSAISQQNNRVQNVGYSSYWNNSNRTVPKTNSYDTERPMSEDIWFPTEKEAIDAQVAIINIISKQGYATVNQLYDQAQLSVPHTAEDWGWTDFTRSRIIPGVNSKGEDGWVLSTPRPIGIKR